MPNFLITFPQAIGVAWSIKYSLKSKFIPLRGYEFVKKLCFCAYMQAMCLRPIVYMIGRRRDFNLFLKTLVFWKKEKKEKDKEIVRLDLCRVNLPQN